jgi:hypothetical protein
LFGHKGVSAAQINAAIKRQSVDPNMFVGQEFDRSAQSTFGGTLGTTFSEGPGGTFSNAAINSSSQAPVVNIQMPVNSIDSQDTAKFIQKNAAVIAKHVGDQIAKTGSGLARKARAAINPA